MSSSQFSDRSDWKRLSFSLDLVRQAKYYVEFLKYVDERVGFREPEALKKAIYRYEKHWLPFCATETDLDLKKYFPPTDVAWVWYCHMLNPVAYRHDTEAYCGRIIDHSLCSLFDIKAKQEITRPKWEQFQSNKNSNNQSFSFDHTNENSIGSDRDEFDVFESKLSFDLLNVSSRLKNFSYQISLPHFNSFEYLTFCVDRYKKFLFLIKHKTDGAAAAPTDHDLLTTVPCNGIEVIWHSHLLSPHVYASGTTKILGKLLPHYENFPDDQSSSRSSDENVQKLWRESFDEEFFFPGCMYRGDRPTPAVFSTNNDLEYDLFFVRNGSIKLSETSLTCKKETKHADKARYRMLVTQNRRPIYEGDLSLSESLRFVQTYSFENFSESSLNLRVVVRYRESLADKLVSTFKYLPKHDGSCDVYFDPRLIVPEKGTENQYFTYCIRDPRGNEFALDQRWRIETRVLRTIRFTVFQEPFQAIDMKYIVNDYEVFDLQREDFAGEKGEGIRAQHSISSMINNYEETLFVAEILHIVSLQWSSVRIMKDNQVYATSHLIGPSQLPPKSKIKYEKSYLTLDPRDERAVLVRNLAGDYAILIGKWVENKDIVNSLKMKKDSRKVNNQKQNGRLEVKLYQLEKKTSTSTPMTSIEIPLDVPFEFESASTKTRVDLRTGNIEVKFLKDTANTLEIESNLAVVFGVALLHVMLQPKPGPYYSQPRMSRDKISQINPYYSSSSDIPPSATTTSTSTTTTTTNAIRGTATSINDSRHSISNSSIRMTSYKLFSCIGYIDLVYLDSFFNECYKITQIEKSNNNNNNNNNKVKNSNNKNAAKEIPPRNYYHWFPDAFVNFINVAR